MVVLAAQSTVHAWASEYFTRRCDAHGSQRGKLGNRSDAKEMLTKPIKLIIIAVTTRYLGYISPKWDLATMIHQGSEVRVDNRIVCTLSQRSGSRTFAIWLIEHQILDRTRQKTWSYGNDHGHIGTARHFLGSQRSRKVSHRT